MDKRSTGGMAEEWRQQGISGYTLCRLSIGAACRGGVSCAGLVGMDLAAKDT
jgi:hypothetical protein